MHHVLEDVFLSVFFSGLDATAFLSLKCKTMSYSPTLSNEEKLFYFLMSTITRIELITGTLLIDSKKQILCTPNQLDLDP